MSELNQRARARIKSLFVGVSFPVPTVDLVHTIAASPLAVTASFPAPGPNITTPAQTALAVAVTMVAPTLALAATPSPLAVTVSFPVPTVVVV